MEQAGLVLPRKSGEGYYDRFRDRLIIPIHDLQGRIVGFGGRTLTNEEPKYLNSPETELFNKGKLLFGLDKAKRAIVQQDRAVVVEGYFDVIALHAAGISNAVASMGTALSLEQMRQLLRYSESKQIILNFDADAAGNKAAERAISEIEALAYQGEVKLRVINIPDGKDADEFLREHPPAAFQEILDAAPLWLDWQIDTLIQGQDLSQPDQFQDATQRIVELLMDIPNPIVRNHYVRHCAELLRSSDAQRTTEIEKALWDRIRWRRRPGELKKWQRPTDVTLREAAEAQILRIYLHRTQHRQTIREILAERSLEFSFSHHRFLWRQVLELEEQAAANSTPPGVVPHPELVVVPEDLNIVALLQDLCMEYPQEIQQVYHLLQLNEKTELDILRPTLSIRAAAASLERIACEKRCRLLLSKLEAAIESATLELGQKQILSAYLQHLLDDESEQVQTLMAEESHCLRELSEVKRLYYQEKRYLQQLDQQRCVVGSDLGALVEDNFIHLN